MSLSNRYMESINDGQKGGDMNTLTVKVLGYFEDGEWVAHALELDLVGTGDSFEAASEELKGAIDAQVSFAIEQGNVDLIFKSAPKKYWTIYNKAQRDTFSRTIGNNNSSSNHHGYRLMDYPLAAAQHV